AAGLGPREFANPGAARRAAQSADRGARAARVEGKPRADRPRSGADEIRRARAPILRRPRAKPMIGFDAFSVGALYLAGREWLWPAIAIFIVALGFVAASYFRTAAPARLRLACAALKLAGVAAVLACLIEPMWTGQRAKPGANLLAI